MCISRLVGFCLWGNDKWKAEYFNRMGDCFYFTFFRFQIIRSFYLSFMIIFTFLTLYFDLRIFIFLLQDWKMLVNCIAIALIFVFSGKQRTDILYSTKAYFVLKLGQNSEINEDEDDEEVKEGLKSLALWKSVILLYELAQTLNIFHTFVFWAFWREGMIEYYNAKQPPTEINKQMRLIIMYTINTIPPLFMIFDMIFSKIIFRLYHVLFGLLCSLLLFILQIIGREIFPSKF